MFSAVARQASRSSAALSRRPPSLAATRRPISADAKPLNPFSMVDNPIVGGIVLVGLTAVLGVFMYQYDEELPQGPPKEQAAA